MIEKLKVYGEAVVMYLIMRFVLFVFRVDMSEADNVLLFLIVLAYIDEGR